MELNVETRTHEYNDGACIQRTSESKFFIFVNCNTSHPCLFTGCCRQSLILDGSPMVQFNRFSLRWFNLSRMAFDSVSKILFLIPMMAHRFSIIRFPFAFNIFKFNLLLSMIATSKKPCHQMISELLDLLGHSIVLYHLKPSSDWIGHSYYFHL